MELEKVTKLYRELETGQARLLALKAATLLGAKAELAIQILEKVSSPAVAQILIRKYVKQETFREIAKAMRYSMRHVFRLHEKGKKKFKE